MAGVDELLGMQSIWGIIKSWPDDPMAECVIDGEIMKAPGYTDGIGMAVIPFTIIVPA